MWTQTAVHHLIPYRRTIPTSTAPTSHLKSLLMDYMTQAGEWTSAKSQWRTKQAKEIHSSKYCTTDSKVCCFLVDNQKLTCLITAESIQLFLENSLYANFPPCSWRVSVCLLYSSCILFCRCAVDRLQTENGSLLIICTDASGKNTSAGRILEITPGKDYGELEFPYDCPKQKNMYRCIFILFLKFGIYSYR